MARVSERLHDAERALGSLEDLVKLAKPSVVERDAAIARFTYTFEAVWKAARDILLDREGIDAASPKACIRASRRVALLGDEQAEAALKAADDRNLIVHVYKEALAQALFLRLAEHSAVLNAWLVALRDRDRRS